MIFQSFNRKENVLGFPRSENHLLVPNTIVEINCFSISIISVPLRNTVSCFTRIITYTQFVGTTEELIPNTENL